MKEVEIKFQGIPLKVVGTYEVGEEEVMYASDMSGYPGSASYFDISEIYVTDSEINLYELFSWQQLEVIIDLVIDKIEKDGIGH